MAQEIADSTLLDTWASSGNIIEPDSAKIIEGWQLGEQPPHEYMNWLQNTFGSKLNHILKNGVAKWNNETEYLAGSSVQHNGNVWLCKATNKNSAPTDVNANWKRIITVESLTTVLNGYVATTGNQTIAGVKTFSSSPIVPTPTAGTHSANKDYVDSSNSANVKLSGNQTIAGVKTFSSNPISTATQSTATNSLTRKDYVDGLDSANVKLTGNQTISGVKTFSSTIAGSINGNSGTATKLATARTIGGVSFDGTANINLPGVNTTGNQNTTGIAAGVTNGVYTVGNQTIGGVKTFSSNPLMLVGQSTNANALTKYSSVVKVFGDETIAGVKTFSSSPIVPTPTAGTHSANKDYVDNKSAASGVGVGQTWQNMTASRSANVTYTNTTGRAIQVLIGHYEQNSALTFTINGNAIPLMANSSFRQSVVISAIVPANNTYSFSVKNDSTTWLELR